MHWSDNDIVYSILCNLQGWMGVPCIPLVSLKQLWCSWVHLLWLVMTVAVCVAHEGLQEREEACAGEVSRSHIAWRWHDKVISVVSMLYICIVLKLSKNVSAAQMSYHWLYSRDRKRSQKGKKVNKKEKLWSKIHWKFTSSFR